MSKIEAEVYALSDFNTMLRKSNESIDSIMVESKRAFESEINRLESIRQERQFEVEKCERALQHCLSTPVDEDEPPPSCHAEELALQEAQQKLNEIENHLETFRSNGETLLEKIESLFISTMNATSNARGYLEKHIKELLDYLKSHPGEIEGFRGAGDHKTQYQRARKEWFRRGAAGELENEPNHLTGWMRQEVHRGGSYYRSPGRLRNVQRVSQYETGHIVAGIDVPENFRWELRADNILRPHNARRYNLPRTYY